MQPAEGGNSGPLYDAIGHGYRQYRRPDRRLAVAIERVLGDAVSVVNVGAGAGSYEPTDRRVVAVEPSPVMIRQRPPGSAPVVQASATHLPFRRAAFDASLAVLTIHHWPDQSGGLAELARVARQRAVLVTWDPETAGFWLSEDYFPELDMDRRIFPPMSELRRMLGAIEVHPFPVPHDCTDGFAGAYWRRPDAYLDAGVRGAISTFSKFDARAGLARLRRDLADGTWQRHHGDLELRSELDLGYRIVVAGRGN